MTPSRSPPISNHMDPVALSAGAGSAAVGATGSGSAIGAGATAGSTAIAAVPVEAGGLVVVSLVATAADAAAASFSGAPVCCGIARGLRTRGSLPGFVAPIAGESEGLRVMGAGIASGLATSLSTGITSRAGVLSTAGTAGATISAAAAVG